MHENIADQRKRDIAILGKFVALYCQGRHAKKQKAIVIGHGKIERCIAPLSLRLCDECAKLFLYAASKRFICPYHPKPACKDCEAHCYGETHRNKIREIMRYSGMRMILRGKVSYIKKFFQNKKV